jgi:hypothetical protein
MIRARTGGEASSEFCGVPTGGVGWNVAAADNSSAVIRRALRTTGAGDPGSGEVAVWDVEGAGKEANDVFSSCPSGGTAGTVWLFEEGATGTVATSTTARHLTHRIRLPASSSLTKKADWQAGHFTPIGTAILLLCYRRHHQVNR